MTTVVIAVCEVWPYAALAFANEKALLRYLQQLYPDKKRLRVQWWSEEERGTVLNHTTPLSSTWFYRVWRVKLQP